MPERLLQNSKAFHAARVPKTDEPSNGQLRSGKPLRRRSSAGLAGVSRATTSGFMLDSRSVFAAFFASRIISSLAG